MVKVGLLEGETGNLYAECFGCGMKRRVDVAVVGVVLRNAGWRDGYCARCVAECVAERSGEAGAGEAEGEFGAAEGVEGKAAGSDQSVDDP